MIDTVMYYLAWLSFLSLFAVVGKRTTGSNKEKNLYEKLDEINPTADE